MEFVPPDDITQPSRSNPLLLIHRVMGSAALDDGTQALRRERHPVLIEEVDDPSGECFHFFVNVPFVLTLATDFQQTGDVLFTGDHLLEEVAGPSSLHHTSPWAATNTPLRIHLNS